MADRNIDIAILGGGLAGLAASILLVRQGFSVVLLEKQQFPFHRVCGEYISNESWDFIQRLGVDLESLELPQIKRLNISTSKGGYISNHMKLGGFGISRFTLDQLLANSARQEGVEVLENTTVRSVQFEQDHHVVETTAGTFCARLTIGAHGKRSGIDKQLQRDFIQKPLPPSRNFTGIKYHVQADLPPDIIELHIVKEGYCGISKVDNNRYCMAYLITADALQRHGGDINAMEAACFHQNKHLKRYFTEFESLYEKPLVISQVNFSRKSTVENHVMMAGDAAGLITPLCGNGMSMALRAADLMAPLATDFLNNKRSRLELETTYTKLWKREFATRLAAGRALQHLFFNERLIDVSLRALKPFPSLVNGIVGLTHGKPF